MVCRWWTWIIWDSRMIHFNLWCYSSMLKWLVFKHFQPESKLLSAIVNSMLSKHIQLDVNAIWITLFKSGNRKCLEPGMLVVECNSERNYLKHLCNIKFIVWGMTLGYRNQGRGMFKFYIASKTKVLIYRTFNPIVWSLYGQKNQ